MSDVKYPDAELYPPTQDDTMTGKWFVEAMGVIDGYFRCIRTDFGGLDAPLDDTDDDDFLFDSEYDAHVAAAAWYHDTHRNYPYRVEWKACAPQGNQIWTPDVESQVMDFE